ncbi:hypothetical protein [Nonomuraea soli]|uniref:YtkA-like domain-containing protein n=1 Tax=Nonomuraea soli TaxID=1032476 RepID=A0A7W0CUA6_9ACTN|nr:hypothetical protein [Nonomuraea soli]MBA2897441.1 hypothetical protein [Nonomuraea soli]
MRKILAYAIVAVLTLTAAACSAAPETPPVPLSFAGSGSKDMPGLKLYGEYDITISHDAGDDPEAFLFFIAWVYEDVDSPEAIILKDRDKRKNTVTITREYDGIYELAIAAADNEKWKVDFKPKP